MPDFFACTHAVHSWATLSAFEVGKLEVLTGSGKPLLQVGLHTQPPGPTASSARTGSWQLSKTAHGQS
jgi:hypothetical protein